MMHVALDIFGMHLGDDMKLLLCRKCACIYTLKIMATCDGSAFPEYLQALLPCEAETKAEDRWTGMNTAGC